ncbi:RtcB family protein [Alkalibacterium sp. f15]|uniref:RtcB family protein n=1 Tax=Alkalibacterium sp. f15 TaxID=3414029 RepID=UPI003BF85EBD
MFELEGKYNKAKVFADKLEEGAIEQIVTFCNQPHSKGSRIRIMPDAHQGAGSTIGTTMTVTDTVVPNLVGVDIGCGLSVAIVKINPADLAFDRVDDVIRRYIPCGSSTQPPNHFHRFGKLVKYRDIKAPIDLERAKASIGTLGGGNHFIEINAYDEDHIAVVVHSGSRNLGKRIAEFHQDRAYDELIAQRDTHAAIVAQRKKDENQKDIQSTLQTIAEQTIPKELAYLKGESFADYLNDMTIAQHYAELNRQAMLETLLAQMNWTAVDAFSTIHNYIDMENMILRKGAISAQKDERVIIPLNMRDGSIIAYGKGNEDWNYSAPHGAGRLMSRTKAKKMVALADFKKTMKEVWSSSVKLSTLDESPMAYKPMDEIIEQIKETVTIDRIIKPLYNFKAN